MSPEFDQGFQEKFHRAMIFMINSAEYAAVFARFRLAYEYRRQFPWLEEGRKRSTIEGGLVYALRAALATYLVTELPSEEERASRATSQDVQGPYTTDEVTVDPVWKGRLVAAVAGTIAEGFSLERFENRLSRSGVNVDAITPDVLETHIVAALENYYNLRAVSLSPDPL